MAVTSSAIANAGKENMARSLYGDPVHYIYLSMGVGNGTTPAASTDTTLVGNESYYVDVNGSYESDYKAIYKKTFEYPNLPSHIFSEAGVFKNTSEITSMLGRIVYTPITLNESDLIEITIKLQY